MFTLRFPHRRLAILVLLGFVAQDLHAAQVDLSEFSLEQLLDVKVISASKFEQLASTAPSAVQVIERQEIERHGWRTLTDALNSLPGLYSINDRAYDFLGARGFLIPGDYNTRFLLLIDGQRNNDNIYQQALLGSEGWLDMSVVERIEYIPGPGSAIYGSNAMFGVINVITRRAGKTAHSQADAQVSLLGQRRVNVMTSQTMNDTGLMLQCSAEHQAGRDLTYADSVGNLFRADGSAATDSVAHGLDSGNNRQLMMRADHDEWSFKLINHERNIRPSSALYFTVFDDPALKLTDEGTQLSASMQHELSSTSSVYLRLGYIDWSYRATYPYFDFAGVGYYKNYDDIRGRILDGELRYQLESGAHHLLGGMEFSRDLLARQHNFYSATAPFGSADTDINTLIKHSGLFVQDEWRFAEHWLFNLGLRLDSTTYSKSTFSPRLGLIWQVNNEWTAKLLAGRAYRSPNAYESQFGDGVNYLSNPNLLPEIIHTTEGVLEWLSDARSRWMLSVFDNRVDHLIRQVDTGGAGVGPFQYQNGTPVRMRGVELGVEKATGADLKLRTSIAYNQPQNSQGVHQENSPHWIGKVSVNAPVYAQSAFLAAELQANGPRSYDWNATHYGMGSEIFANATATFPDVLAKGMQLQLRVTNLFDRDMQHPAAAEMPTATIPQNGRNLMAKLEYAF